MSRLDARKALRPHRPMLSVTRLKALFAIRRQRARLARLDDAALTDIGLSRHEAEAEARRPIWDAPHSWYR